MAAVRQNFGPGLIRALAQEHISMIAFSANIGFGFTINSGRILHLVGPGGATLAYVIASLIVVLLISPFVEMASVVDLVGPLWELPTGLVDSVLGPTLGFMFLFTFLAVYPEELAMTARLIAFDYRPDKDLPLHDSIPTVQWKGILGADPKIWIALALVTSAAVNMLRIKWYGRCEYFFGVFKLISLVILILAQIAINAAGKVGEGHSIGTRYWWGCDKASNCTTSTGFVTKTLQIGDVKGDSNSYMNSSDAAPFLAMWTAIIYSFFGFLGSALVPIAAREAEDPRCGLKSANRKSLFRVCTLYCIGIFAVSFNVPYNHPQLHPFRSHNLSASANAPIMIAIVESGYTGLAHFANFFFVFATWSCATSTLFITSRVLYSLAMNDRLPFERLNHRLKTTTANGVPRNAVIASALSGALGFLGSKKDSKPQMALDCLTAIGTNCWLIVFACLSVTFIYYYRHLQRRNAAYQGHEAAFNRDSARRRSLQLQDMSPSPSSQSISQDQGHPEQPEAPDQIYPYRTWGQPERVYLGAFICLLLLIFGGWWVWLNPRRLAEEIISNYLAHVFFLFLYAGIRIHRRNQLGSRIFGFVPAKGLLLNVDTRFVAAEREDEKAESWWLKVPRVVFHWVFW